MTDRSRSLPLTTRLEGLLTRSAALRWLIEKIHQKRKTFYIARQRRRDARRPSDLRNFERKVHSQYGEDGIIAEIFRRIGTTSRLAVEFGIENGSECNTRDLIENHGWSAVLIDGSERHAAAAQSRFEGKPVQVLERFLTTQNILTVFGEAGVPSEFDLLSIDVDGNDYWFWAELLTAYRPRVVVIEYNGRWPPPKRWVMPFNPDHRWDGSVYYGASLQSLADLGARHGYTLVACSAAGLNAFFVRSDVLGDHFPSAESGPRYHYAAPLYTLGFGHPVRGLKKAT